MPSSIPLFCRFAKDCAYSLAIETCSPPGQSTLLHPGSTLSFRRTLSLLPPERASLCQTSFSTSGLAQHGRAAGADDDGLGVREDGCDGEAAGAFDVHEEGAGGGDEGLWN